MAFSLSSCVVSLDEKQVPVRQLSVLKISCSRLLCRKGNVESWLCMALTERSYNWPETVLCFGCRRTFVEERLGGFAWLLAAFLSEWAELSSVSQSASSRKDVSQHNLRSAQNSIARGSNGRRQRIRSVEEGPGVRHSGPSWREMCNFQSSKRADNAKKE